MIRRRLLLVLLIALVSPIGGCALLAPRPTINQVQDVRALGIRVANGIEKVGLATEGVQLTEIALHDAKFIGDEEHRSIQIGFKAFAIIVLESIKRARNAISAPELRSTVTGITDGLTDLGKKLQVSHPNAANVLGSAMVALSATAAVILAIL